MDLSEFPIGANVKVVKDNLDTGWKGAKGKVVEHDFDMNIFPFHTPIAVTFENEPFPRFFSPDELQVIELPVQTELEMN